MGDRGSRCETSLSQLTGGVVSYKFSETGLQIFLSTPLKERRLSGVEADLSV